MDTVHSAARRAWYGTALLLLCSAQASIAQQQITPSSIAAHGLPIRADTVDGLGRRKGCTQLVRFLRLRRGARDDWRKAGVSRHNELHVEREGNISERHPRSRRNDARPVVAALPRSNGFGVGHVHWAARDRLVAPERSSCDSRLPVAGDELRRANAAVDPARVTARGRLPRQSLDVQHLEEYRGQGNDRRVER